MSRLARQIRRELAASGYPLMRRGAVVGVLDTDGTVTTYNTRRLDRSGWTPVAAAELTDRQAAYAISALRRMHP